jgi:sulfite reductase (NADPH) flavoprotein alpha-component
VLQVTNSPFNQEQADLFNRLLPNLTKEQLIWLSGYLAALYGVGSSVTIDSTLLASPGTNLALSGINDSSDSKEVTVLFGSQTGNCQRLSKDLSRRLEELGFNVSLFSMSDFKPNSLKKVRNLLILVSTHGEGDPPDNALPFFEFLHSKRAPQLEDLQYSVLALGDSSYEFFCKTGKDFDQRLDELGGKRLCPRTDCDLDYDEPVLEWFNNVVSALGKIPEASALATEVTLAVGNGFPAEQSGYSRTFPFEAEVLENLNLNGRGSNQETRHIELSLAGSKLQFEPGDALGI